VPHSRVATLALTLALPVAAVAACGDDADTQATPEPPKLTVPRTDTEPERTSPRTVPQPPPAPPAPEPDYENAPAPAPPNRADSPQNDTPPPPGSPAERFEEACERNPEACG
jgi:hypothetical protein